MRTGLLCLLLFLVGALLLMHSYQEPSHLYAVVMLGGTFKQYPVKLDAADHSRECPADLTNLGSDQFYFVPKHELGRPMSKAELGNEQLGYREFLYRVNWATVWGRDRLAYTLFVQLQADGRPKSVTKDNLFYLPLLNGWIRQKEEGTR